LQATRVPKIIIGPDAPDPVKPSETERVPARETAEPVTSEFDKSQFAGCYKIDNDEDEDLY